MRVLRLDGSDESKRAFLHLHAAMHATEVKGIEQIKRVGKIVDKLEAIGVERTVTEQDQRTGADVERKRWQLAGEGGALWLEDAEFDELRARMNGTQWLPGAARYVARTFEMLDAAKEEDPSKPKLVPNTEPEPEKAVAQA